MQSTKSSLATCAYLGVDVTDRFSKAARPMDVCGLEPKTDGLIAHFWKWSWGRPGNVSVSAVLHEFRAARSLMLDAPQGLAQLGRNIRCSEKLLGAAGKTGETRPPLTQVYGGFICSSLDLFAAFHAAGLAISPTSLLGVCEVYPAAIWTRLAHRIPNKRQVPGREARAALMHGLGVALPVAVPTHDQLDACAAALLGAAADGRISGMKVAPVGEPVYWDATDGCLREGPILLPDVDAELSASLESIVRPWASMLPRARPRIPRPATGSAMKRDATSQTVGRPVLTDTTREGRAAELFAQLTAELVDGRPTLCTYKAAVATILGYPKYTPAYGAQLTRLATAGAAFEVDGLGDIHLDTFLVNQKYRPGDGHWEHATYSENEWDRAFVSAWVIE